MNSYRMPLLMLTAGFFLVSIDPLVAQDNNNGSGVDPILDQSNSGVDVTPVGPEPLPPQEEDATNLQPLPPETTVTDQPINSIILNSTQTTPTVKKKNRMDCKLAGLRCAVYPMCLMALTVYRLRCDRNPAVASFCDATCIAPTNVLARIPEGYDYLNCDCDKDIICQMIRRRTNFCLKSESL